jgi:predicted PurR-regulated permease PerM
VKSENTRNVVKSILKILLVAAIYVLGIMIFSDFFLTCEGILFFATFNAALLLFIHFFFRHERKSAEKYRRLMYYFSMFCLICWLMWIVYNTLSECA